MNSKAKKQKIKANKQTNKQKKHNRNFWERHNRELYIMFSTKSKKSD